MAQPNEKSTGENPISNGATDFKSPRICWVSACAIGFFQWRTNGAGILRRHWLRL
jgi:hypothetical protein